MVVGEYTGKIADYVVDFGYGDIPQDAVEHSKLVILDTIGAMIAAANPSYPAGGIIRDHVLDQGGRGEASVVGRGVKVPATSAALANGTLAYLCDVESYHVKAVLHETAVVFPAAFAVAERENLGGSDLLASFVLGIDVETRLSYAISPTGMYARGFHPTVVAGCLGAAVSAGKLLALNRGELANALGLAAAQSSGLLSWESDVTEMSRPFGCGVAAQNGVKAALLAGSGFGGPEVFEGKYTVFDAFSGEAHAEELLDGLGSRFEVMNLTFKRYSSCAFTHPGLDAFLKIMEGRGLKAEEIEGITVRFPASGAKLIDRSELRSHNLQYVLSIAAHRGQVMFDDILFEQRSEGIPELADRVTLIHDEGLDPFFPETMPTIVEVTTKDGSTFTERVDSAKGTPENPMTPGEVREKYRRLAKTVVDEGDAEEIERAVNRLDRMRDVGELAELLRLGG